MLIPIVVYLICMGLIVILQPPIAYLRDGSLKRFGSGPNETYFPLWVIAIVFAVTIGFIYSLFSGSAEVIEVRMVE